MGIIEFFFNSDYRDILSNKTEYIEKFSFKNELRNGQQLHIGVFTVIVTKINNNNFYGVIIKQDEKKSMFYPNHTNYVGTIQKFTNYHNVL